MATHSGLCVRLQRPASGLGSWGRRAGGSGPLSIPDRPPAESFAPASKAWTCSQTGRPRPGSEAWWPWGTGEWPSSPDPNRSFLWCGQPVGARPFTHPRQRRAHRSGRHEGKRTHFAHFACFVVAPPIVLARTGLRPYAAAHLRGPPASGGHERPGAYALDLSRGTGIIPTVWPKGNGMSRVERGRVRRTCRSANPGFESSVFRKAARGCRTSGLMAGECMR